MWNAKTHEVKKMCLGMKDCTLTNGGECKKLNPMTPKCTPTLGVAFVHSSEYLKHRLKWQTIINLRPQDTIGKVLKCIFCLDMKCMSYD